MVSSGSGILSEYRGVTETPRGSIGPTWALVEREEARKGWPRPPMGVRIGLGEGAAPEGNMP